MSCVAVRRSDISLSLSKGRGVDDNRPLYRPVLPIAADRSRAERETDETGGAVPWSGDAPLPLSAHRGANGAAWGDIDVRAHQRVPRYRSSCLHAPTLLGRQRTHGMVVSQGTPT